MIGICKANMSKTKQGGSSRLGRDSASQRLGVKISAGQKVRIGMIIIRQRGTKYHPGENVGRGNDDTLYALKSGLVEFREKRVAAFNGNRERRMFVSVVINSNLTRLGQGASRGRKPQTSKVHLKN